MNKIHETLLSTRVSCVLTAESQVNCYVLQDYKFRQIYCV